MSCAPNASHKRSAIGVKDQQIVWSTPRDWWWGPSSHAFDEAGRKNALFVTVCWIMVTAKLGKAGNERGAIGGIKLLLSHK
jgi:hypothetical protein